MVYIITKNDGPRKEDVAARKLIENNRSTIERLANHLTGGRWQEIRQARSVAPVVTEPERATVAGYQPTGRSTSTRPYVRISPNNRVVVVDEETSRQVLFLGELRRGPEGERFRLATRENGFFDPLEGDALDCLLDLDGLLMPGEEVHEAFKQELASRLGIADTTSGGA